MWVLHTYLPGSRRDQESDDRRQYAAPYLPSFNCARTYTSIIWFNHTPTQIPQLHRLRPMLSGDAYLLLTYVSYYSYPQPFLLKRYWNLLRIMYRLTDASAVSRKNSHLLGVACVVSWSSSSPPSASSLLFSSLSRKISLCRKLLFLGLLKITCHAHPHEQKLCTRYF